MTPLQVIEAATANGAETLGLRAPKAGQLLEGYDTVFFKRFSKSPNSGFFPEPQKKITNSIKKSLNSTKKIKNSLQNAKNSSK